MHKVGKKTIVILGCPVNNIYIYIYIYIKGLRSLNILNGLVALKNLNDTRDMNWTSDIIREKIKFSVK